MYEGAFFMSCNKTIFKYGTTCIIAVLRASGGMVYTKDLKSFGSNAMRVRLPPRPPNHLTSIRV